MQYRVTDLLSSVDYFCRSCLVDNVGIFRQFILIRFYGSTPV